jgi:DNA repair photolyase
LYANTPELLKQELPRKRHLPRRVFFSPSSDAFQYPPEIQEISLRTMTILLEAGIQVAFLTKGFITKGFIELFRAYADSIFAQIGISTLDRELWRALEPRAASPQRRMATVRQLRNIGVAVTTRLDPLFPGVTDTPANLEPLLRELHGADVADASASYLFLRPAFARNMETQLARLGIARARNADWEHTDFLGGCGGGRMLNRAERKRRFDALSALGESYGITIRVCRCKNPDLAATGCGIAGPGRASEAPERNQPLLPFAQRSRCDI